MQNIRKPMLAQRRHHKWRRRLGAKPQLSSGARRHHAVGQNAIREGREEFHRNVATLQGSTLHAPSQTVTSPLRLMTGSVRPVPSRIAMN